MQDVIEFIINYGDEFELSSPVQSVESDSIVKLRSVVSEWMDANAVTGDYTIRFV